MATNATNADRIPVFIITGFLGSGKTTLLQRMLSEPGFENTAVVINEFGEAGLDHQLVSHLNGSVLLLENGCACCAVRDDLRESLIGLIAQRSSGRYFDQIILETSGLSDPAPIIFTLLADITLNTHLVLHGVITTVDAVSGSKLINGQVEAQRQIALADAVVLTKTDLPGSLAGVSELRSTCRSLNELAFVAVSQDEDFAVNELLADSRNRRMERLGQIRRESQPVAHDFHSFSLFTHEALDWSAFTIWLTLLLHERGSDLIRVKGLIAVPGSETPVVIQGVQHMMYPPVHLEEWPTASRQSQMTFIARKLTAAEVERSFQEFLRSVGLAPQDLRLSA